MQKDNDPIVVAAGKVYDAIKELAKAIGCTFEEAIEVIMIVHNKQKEV